MAEGDAVRPTDQTRAALAEDSVEDLYEHAPCGYLSAYADGVLVRVNQTFLDWTGYSREELLGRKRFADLLTVGGRIYHETHFAPLLRMQQSVRSIALDMVRADGTPLPVLVNAHLRTDGDGRPLAVRTTVFDASDRRAYETELLAARRRAEQATGRLRVAEQVVAQLAAASSVASVAEVVGTAGIAAFGADASAVWLHDEGGQHPGSFVWAGPTPLPLDRLADVPVRLPLAEGGIVVVADGAHDDSLAPFHLALGSGPGATVLTPLSAGDRTLGVLALRLAHNNPPDPDELRLLHTLGGQTGLALERARLSDLQANVASTLQHSMLSRNLPDDPRLSISASYLPAVSGLQVGGDWYDAFCIDRDRIALVVGDVVGRGLDAAAAMGQLRSAVRALALTDAGPGTLLEHLDRFVEGVEAAESATMAYVEVDLRAATARLACAGHPPPILVDPAGRPELLWDGRSTPLGAHFGIGARPETEVALVPGARLALYTDGLVERRDQPLDECIEALAEELAARSGRPFTGLAADIVTSILGSEPTGDDVCLLTVAFHENPTFVTAIAAEPTQLAVLRHDLTHWLESNDVTGDECAAVVLAASEAAGNAVEHGYRSGEGTIEVLATLGPDELRLRVRDTGAWRTPPTTSTRGRGLKIIESLMDRVVVERGDGTTVMMHKYTGKGAMP